MYIDGKKGSLILILKTLEEYSDSNHFLTQQDIIDKMVQQRKIKNANQRFFI